MKKKFWIVNKINPTTAQILIYGYISPYDVNSTDFLIELTTLAAQFHNIQIRINSGGGSVFEGIAIRSAIKTFIKAGKNVETYVDGIAASMAAPIAIAGTKVYISKFARMMFHRASGFAEGTADDIRRQADMIENCEKDIIQMIADKSGMSTSVVKEKLFQPGVDKWVGAQEAIDMKLADEIFDSEEVPVPQNITGTKDLVNIFESVLNKNKSLELSKSDKKYLEDMIPHHQMAISMSEKILQTTKEPFVIKLAEGIIKAQKKEIAEIEEVLGEEETDNKKKMPMKMSTEKKYNMKKELLQKLGLPENATDEQIDAAVEKSLTDVENKLADAETKTVEELVDRAINVDKKLVATDKEAWVKNFKGNVEGLKMAIAKLPGAVKPTQVINQQTAYVAGAPEEDDEPDTNKKGWDGLTAKGMKAIEKFRNENREEYDRLYQEKFGRKSVEMGFRKPGD